ncbi:hypothetical protein [Staphylococcus xylosus]|uniref:hypothetical protein n=1 Tax=Staphylococcus xylosus TaxID=1288 RepID=UPI00403EB3BD
MNKNTVLDKGYFIATILNAIFLLGLIFVYQSDNLYIIFPYSILMVINAIYLVVKVGKINRDKPKI